MSTKTTFKRIALVAVAALGFGVLSVVPSQATVSGLVVTATNGTATTATSDSTTAAVLDISFLALAGKLDSVTVSIAPAAAFPATSAGILANAGIFFTESRTSLSGPTNAPTVDQAAVGDAPTDAVPVQAASTQTLDFRVVAPDSAGATNGTFGVKVKFYLGDTPAATTAAGTYSFNAIVGSNSGAAGARVTTVVPFNIVVSGTAAESAAASKVVDASKTVAILTAGGEPNPSTSVNVVDSSVTGSSLADNTTVASFLVKTFNAAGTATAESVTVTMAGAGSLKLVSSGVVGNSFSLTGAGGSTEIDVIANGVAGVGSIVISTPTKTFAPKLVTFYAANPATIVPVVSKPVVATGATSGAAAIALDAKDANGNLWAGQAYLFSTDTAVATAGACAWDGTLELHLCSVTGVAEGQSKFRVGNASTLALSTVAIAEFNGPRVSTQVPASVKMEFDKATYQPGEKAKVYITVLDAAGNTLPAGTYTNVFATGGITPSLAFGAGADNGAETLTATSITTDASTSAVTLTRAGSEMYSFIMGTASGTVELTAKGGIGLPLAGQVAVTASAEVTNSAEDAANEALDAAIAATDASILAEEAAANAEAAATAAAETAEAALDAVTALSAQVTKLVAQLASLQKLVNKIAKRVGAKK